MKDMKIPIPSTENEQIPVPISPFGTLSFPTIANACFLKTRYPRGEMFSQNTVLKTALTHI